VPFRNANLTKEEFRLKMGSVQAFAPQTTQYACTTNYMSDFHF